MIAFDQSSAGSSMIMMCRLSFCTIKCDGCASESWLWPTTASMEKVLNACVYVQSFCVAVHHLFTHAPLIQRIKAMTAPIANKRYQGGVRLRYLGRSTSSSISFVYRSC